MMRKYYEMTLTLCVKVEMKNFNKKNDYEKIKKKKKVSVFNSIHPLKFMFIHGKLFLIVSSSFCLLVSFTVRLDSNL